MKKILFGLALIFTTNQVFSQELTLNETGLYINQQVITTDEQDAEILFNKCMEWIALNYKSAQDVIQYSDKENLKIICKGSFITNLFWKSGFIHHTLSLEIKEGRFRQTYSDFSYVSEGSGKIALESKNLAFKKKILKETSSQVNSATNNLKEYLNTKDNDW